MERKKIDGVGGVPRLMGGNHLNIRVGPIGQFFSFSLFEGKEEE